MTDRTPLTIPPQTPVDARRQPDAEVKARRMQVARLFQAGVRVMEIVRQTGLSWGTVHSVIGKVQAGGISAIEPASRGRKEGQGRALSCAQEANLRKLIRTRAPWFYRLNDRLWTQATVACLIEQTCGLALSRRAVGDYLARWGVELINANSHPSARCTPAVRSWLEQNYADLQEAAQLQRADIWWLNRPIALKGKGWGDSIQASACGDPTKGKERSFRLLSAISGRGTLRWIVIAGNAKPEKQLRLIKGLSMDVRRNLFLIRSDGKDYASNDLHRELPGLNRDVKIYPPRSSG